MFNALSIIFLVLYVLVSLYHLRVCFKKWETPRCFSKPLLMPLLMLFYIFCGNINALIIIALAASFLGDVLLIKMSESRVKIGIAFFLICQVLYTVQWIISASWANATFLGIFIPALLYALLGAILYIVLNSGRGLADMKLPVAVYLIAICLMSFMAFNVMATKGTFPAVLIFIGSLSFIVSDTLLAIETFKGEFKHSNFYIMTTYLIAQVLIVLGICLL